ncbi:MAG: accessory factor UbiK family protein [Pseudohongiella sp.]
MTKRSIIDEISEQISKVLPQVSAAGEEVRETVRGAVEQSLAKMDLLTREEFDAQTRALKRAEDRIAELEEAVKALETHLKH